MKASFEDASRNIFKLSSPFHTALIFLFAALAADGTRMTVTHRKHVHTFKWLLSNQTGSSQMPFPAGLDIN